MTVRSGEGDRAGPVDAGIAGAWTLLLGVLGMATMLWIVLAAWRVVDARLAADGAAREAARTFVEARPGAGTARAAADAEDAARRAAAAQGWAPVEVGHGALALGRCAPASFTVTIAVPPLALPFLGGVGAVTVRATHTETVDPLRGGLDGVAACLGVGP